jgi:hypothetical protein
MSITNYTDLQAALASNSNRSDLTSLIPDFIALAEAEMQRRLKLVDFETTATVTITGGSGSLPTGFAGHRAAKWDGDEDRSLRYITPDRFNALTNIVTVPTFYTVVGSTLKVMSQETGSVELTYNARFTPLSGSNATNAIVTNYPDAYFYGSLIHLYDHTRNDKMVARYEGKFQKVIDQIIKDHKERKYPGPLEVRPR